MVYVHYLHKNGFFNQNIHYMTQTCTDEFLEYKINYGYMHDAFFDTYYDEKSETKYWIYTIKDDNFNV